MSARNWPHYRSRTLSIVAVVLSALCLTGAVVGRWVQATVFDADSFSRRSVAALDSSAVREELAVQLTGQLVQSGNRGAIAFRPAAELVVQTLIETDTFKSIFATAVRETHSALIAGSASSGLDLSDSLSMLAAGLQLNQESKAIKAGTTSTGSSLPDLVSQVADLSVWNMRSEIEHTVAVLWWLSALLALAGLAVAPDRRRAVGHLGLSLAGGGVLIAGGVVVASRLARGLAHDPSLARALQDATWAIAADLKAIGIGQAMIGLVVAAAAMTNERATPAALRDALAGQLRRVRSTTAGTVVLAVLAGALGVLVMTQPATAVAFVGFVAGLALVFAATRLLVNLAAPTRAPAEEEHHVHPLRRWAAYGAVTAALVLLVGSVTVVHVRSQQAHAEGLVDLNCLGSMERCGLRLDEVTLAGGHNAMSAAAYPGWLFAEQIPSLGGQLNSGVRALLIDAHYGRTSSVKMPGSDTRLVITDVAAEFTVPGAESIDPTLKAKAQELAASAPSGDSAKREVFLCHNYCELGAVKMADELKSVRRFLDAHPGELVMIIVQDAVSSKDVAATFEQAGLLDKVATLDRDQPLPTVGELIEAGTPLLVFAERGDKEAPDWYQPAYDWFQETGFTYFSLDEFNCAPNRGSDENPFLLINHWVNKSPPDPKTAERANSTAVLEQRVHECFEERGMRPTVIAADFATRGNLVRFAGELTDGERAP